MTDVTKASGPLWHVPTRANGSGPRFVLFAVSGHVISPNGAYSFKSSTTWVVLDSLDGWSEVAVFEPRAGVSQALCHKRAVTLCKELNAKERSL